MRTSGVAKQRQHDIRHHASAAVEGGDVVVCRADAPTALDGCGVGNGRVQGQDCLREGEERETDNEREVREREGERERRARNSSSKGEKNCVRKTEK